MSRLLLGETGYGTIASEAGVEKVTVWNVKSKLKAHLKQMNLLDEAPRGEVGEVGEVPQTSQTLPVRASPSDTSRAHQLTSPTSPVTSPTSPAT